MCPWPIVPSMPSAARLTRAAAVAAGALPRPRGRAPRDFPCWDSLLGVWTEELGGEGEQRPKQTWRSEHHARSERRRTQRRAERAAAGLPLESKIGRPINPLSKRQQRLAAQPQLQAARQQRTQERQAARAAADAAEVARRQEAAEQLQRNREHFQQVREQLAEERRRRFLLEELLQAEYNLSMDVARSLTSAVGAQLLGPRSHAPLPDDVIAADGVLRRKDILLSAISAMAAGERAWELAQHIKGRQLPEELMAHAKDAPLIIEYLKPEMERSWNKDAAAANAARLAQRLQRVQDAERRAQARALAEFESDARIDAEHEPPRRSRASYTPAQSTMPTAPEAQEEFELGPGQWLDEQGYVRDPWD